jgi:hypothetical protein
MAMPNLSPVNYALKLVSKLEYCCHQTAEEIDLTALGFAIRGDIGMAFRHAEYRPALGHSVISNAHKDAAEPYDLELVSELYATGTPNDFHNEVHEAVMAAVYKAQTGIFDDTGVTYPKHKYLEIGLWKASSFQEYRLYVEVLGYGLVPVWKSNMMIYQAVLRLRVVDPVWYQRGRITYTWPVTNGGSGIPTGTQVAGGPSSQRRVKRIMMKFIHSTAGATGHIINPTVTNDKGESFTITGTIDTDDDYWLVDMIEGRCYEGSSYSNQVDVTGTKFSGDFIGIDYINTDSLVVTSPTAAGSITYDAHVEYVNAEM